VRSFADDVCSDACSNNLGSKVSPVARNVFSSKADHQRFISLSDLLPVYLAVPADDVLMDDERYVSSLDGCVLHDGVADRGMFWIDTAVQPPHLVLCALDIIGGESESGTDEFVMWVFSSTRLDWEKLPLNYSASVKRWLDSNDAQGYKERIVMMTLVQPNGVMENLALQSLYFSQNHLPQKGK
jgi:hypothetical protein